MMVRMITASLGFIHPFGHDVGDVVPRMAVQSLLQPLLIQVMADEAHASPQDKQGVEGSDFYVFLGLLPAK